MPVMSLLKQKVCYFSPLQIFLKYYHIEQLGQLLARYDGAATTAQRVVRGWLARRRVVVLREEKRRRDAVRIQAGIYEFPSPQIFGDDSPYIL